MIRVLQRWLVTIRVGEPTDDADLFLMLRRMPDGRLAYSAVLASRPEGNEADLLVGHVVKTHLEQMREASA